MRKDIISIWEGYDFELQIFADDGHIEGESATLYTLKSAIDITAFGDTQHCGQRRASNSWRLGLELGMKCCEPWRPRHHENRYNWNAISWNLHHVVFGLLR